MMGNLHQRPLVIGRERAAALVEHFKSAEDIAVLTGEWNAKERTRFEFQTLVDSPIDFTLLGRDVGIDAPCFARMNYLADNARVVGDAQLAAANAHRWSADKCVRLFVPQENTGSLSIEQFRRRLCQPQQQFVETQILLPLRR